jgi:orotate phosphoribosyltransferase
VITTEGAVRDAARASRSEGALVGVVVCAISRSDVPGGSLADVQLEIRAVLTRAQLDGV